MACVVEAIEKSVELLKLHLICPQRFAVIAVFFCLWRSKRGCRGLSFLSANRTSRRRREHVQGSWLYRRRGLIGFSWHMGVALVLVR